MAILAHGKRCQFLVRSNAVSGFVHERRITVLDWLADLRQFEKHTGVPAKERMR